MNCPELRAAIARKGITSRQIARTLRLSEQAFYNKVQGTSEFKDSEIKILAEVLNLSIAQVNYIFLIAQ